MRTSHFRFSLMFLLLLLQPVFPVYKSVAGSEWIHRAFVAELSFGDCLTSGIVTELNEKLNFTMPEGGILAVADLSKTSDQQRFYILNVKTGQVLLQTWVAHGKNSGEDRALEFSNEVSSFKSSRGLFRIGERIQSPKHGPAILLEGLEPGLNDRAFQREIILHGADYVGEDFIELHGRCGRSLGCPALPQDQMEKVIRLMKPGSLLYIYG